MSQIAKTSGSGLRVALDESESDVLRGLLPQLGLLLEEDAARSDPVVSRLFPHAYDNESEQRSYEGLVGDELRVTKSNSLRLVRDKVGSSGAVDAVLDASEIDAWLTVLTDLRLAIGVRLNITEDRMGGDIDPEDPDAGALSVLDWLGWIQHRTLEELSKE